MKQKTYILLGIIVLFFSCSETKMEQTELVEKELQLDYLDKLPNDTIRYTFNNSIGLDKDLDALLDQPLDEFILKDTLHNSVLMYWHLFEGQLFINKIAINKYAFSGKSNLPVNGDWEISFKEHLMFRYILEINQNDYLLYRDKSVVPKLPYDESRIPILHKFIQNDTVCVNKNWEIAYQCFPRIYEYEYHLFALLLDKKMKYENTYVNLKNTIDIMNAGELSEYYEGNVITLVDLGILDKKYDTRQKWIKRVY